MTNNSGAQGVAELYQAYPYPGHGVIGSVVALMAGPEIRRLQSELGRQDLRVLDAGCGTGEQTLGVARAFPECRVTGLDPNAPSLELARRFAQRYGIGAEFVAGNLAGRPSEGGQYDLIICNGVLHSMPEPSVGLEYLRACAGEHTTLLGMVYGRFGKQAMFQRRDALALLCGEDMPRGDKLKLLRESKLAGNAGPMHYASVLRRRLKFGPRIRAIEALRRVRAGRGEAYQVDSYFHVLEHSFTWREWIDLLEGAGWSFQGWPKKSGMPDRPKQVLRGPARERIEQMSLADQAGIYERLLQPENLYFLAHAQPRPA